LTGESGVGKELAAAVVHERSGRREKPWVAVNCAALHGDTLLAELFGAVRGAYTGSVEARRGAFERADGGTLFLDEIGELAPVAQAALLRALEVGEIQILGGATKRVDVRLVCATNRDLPQEVEAGRFRLDLLHRLNVTEVHLLPLRARPLDVEPLLRHYLDGLPLPAGAGAVLAGRAWPGNVRELRNLARRLQVSARFGDPSLEELRRALGAETSPGRVPVGFGLPCPLEAPALAVDVAERLRRVEALVRSEPSTAAACRKSGLPRGTFFRYLRQVRAGDQGAGTVLASAQAEA